MVSRGELCVSIRFVPGKKCTGTERSSSDGATVRGDLQVLVKEAFQLVSTRCSGSVDTFVKW